MIDPYFEKRIENWAKARRPSCAPNGIKSSMWTAMKAIHLMNGEPELDEDLDGQPLESIPQQTTSKKPVDEIDAAILDQAYKSDYWDKVTKDVIRLHYIYRLDDRTIEKKLRIAFKSFPFHKELAVRKFQCVVERYFDK